MDVTPTAIPDVKIFVPKKHGDHRGFFSETYSRKAMADAGITATFVQDNHSMSAAPGVVRGLHYQLPPKAQGKLVRVIRGAIYDVAVDIRRGSPTFGQWVGEVISAANWKQIWVPPGFAHGFSVLEPDTEVIYKVTDDYSPKDERGIRWNDPALGIDWRVPLEKAILSDRDTKHPMLKDAIDLF
ncbi:MAG: dTDP-4-dehydrorhamnose 3,5-epimerase [Tepidisphaeraceae bacterium]